MVAFVSANTNAANNNCKRGFHYGFNADGNWLNLQSGNANLVGYRQGVQGAITAMAVDRVDDAYERLMKAIAVYNGGTGTGSTWGNMLTATLPTSPTSATNNRTYAIDVMRRYGVPDGIPARTYIWVGGQFGPNHAQPGQDWCFAYGEREREREWEAGSVFSDVRQAASDTDDRGNPQIPVGRIDCTTGAAF